jgi:hypothetical protein
MVTDGRNAAFLFVGFASPLALILVPELPLEPLATRRVDS